MLDKLIFSVPLAGVVCHVPRNARGRRVVVGPGGRCTLVEGVTRLFVRGNPVGFFTGQNVRGGNSVVRATARMMEYLTHCGAWSGVSEVRDIRVHEVAWARYWQADRATVFACSEILAHAVGEVPRRGEYAPTLFRGGGFMCRTPHLALVVYNKNLELTDRGARPDERLHGWWRVEASLRRNELRRATPLDCDRTGPARALERAWSRSGLGDWSAPYKDPVAPRLIRAVARWRAGTAPTGREIRDTRAQGGADMRRTYEDWCAVHTTVASHREALPHIHDPVFLEYKDL